MLPVQTVMIRYMVLVYRWGSGRLGAVGAWGGSLGGSMTGGCARRRGLPPPGLSLPEPGTKRPRRRGSAGSFRGEYYSDLSSSPSLDLSNGFAGLLVSPELGSKSTVPTGMRYFTPSSSASPQ